MSAAAETGMTTLRRVVAVTTYDHMNLLDLSGPLQALATANRLVDADQRYDVHVVSVHGGAITTGCGSVVGFGVGVGVPVSVKSHSSPTTSAPRTAPPAHGTDRCPTFAQQIGWRGARMAAVREPAHTSAGTSSGDSRHMSARPDANTSAGGRRCTLA